MKPILRTACLCGIFSGILGAQSPATPESLTAWPYYKEASGRPGLSDFNLDRDILDKARADEADLRIYDHAGREIPYALHIRRDIDIHTLSTSRTFNRAAEGGASVISCDLGTEPQEHNEAVIATAGDNFRRLAQVEGSADGSQWFTLASQAILFRFSSNGRTVEQNSVGYPVSRYRYVRVRVERDSQVDRSAPEITSFGIERSVRAKGENVSFDVSWQAREADPFQGRPASIWRLDLGGRIPVHNLTINVGQRTFSRPFQLEIVDDPSSSQTLASGDLTRTEEHAAEPVQVEFTEQFARHLKLTVIDDRNPPLDINGGTALGAARQVVLQSPADGVRVYYGNPKGIAPHYDAAAKLPPEAGGAVVMNLGAEQPNPTYQPEAKPLSERSPWLVYLVLIAACAVLAGILLNLARTAARTTASANS